MGVGCSARFYHRTATGQGIVRDFGGFPTGKEMPYESKKVVRGPRGGKCTGYSRTTCPFRLLLANPDMKTGVLIGGDVCGSFTVHTPPLDSGFRRNHHGLAKAAIRGWKWDGAWSCSAGEPAARPKPGDKPSRYIFSFHHRSSIYNSARFARGGPALRLIGRRIFVPMTAPVWPPGADYFPTNGRSADRVAEAWRS